MTDYKTAGQGLNSVFLGMILCIFQFLPVVGRILFIVGTVFILYGLYTAGRVHFGFKNAMICTVIYLVVFFVERFASGLSIVVSILNVVTVYFVCSAGAELLAGKGDAYQAERAQKIWKLYAACLAVSVVCTLVSWVPIINILAWIARIVTAVIQFVAGILYLVFLYNAQRSLRA